MRKIISNYTFDTSAKTVTLTDYSNSKPFSLLSLHYIKNLTTGAYLYNFANTSVSTASISNGNVITLSQVPSGVANGDTLQIVYEAGATPVGQSDTPIFTGNATFDTNTLFVDSVNHRVGIGTTTPATKLQIDATNTLGLKVYNSSAPSSSGGGGISADSVTPTASGQRLGYYLFAGGGSNGAGMIGWSTESWATTKGNRLGFETIAIGSASRIERMSLDETALKPTANLTYGLGVAANYWLALFTRTVNFNSTASLDGSTAGKIILTGTLNIPTGAQNGYVLTSDASGNAAWAVLAGGGNMNTSTYDAAGVAEQLVGRTAAQTLTNKTLTAPVIATIVNTGTLTLPTSTDTLIGKATTDTLTNKTFNTAGTGNVFQINSTSINSVTGSGATVVLKVGATVQTFTLADSTDSTKKLTFSMGGNTTGITGTIAGAFTTNKTVTLPDATDTLVGKSTTDTLSNKTMDTLKMVTGSNKSVGTGTLSAGTATISTTAVTANSVIIVTHTSTSGTIGELYIGTITPGTSFIVNSSNALDANTFSWLIVN